jgi:Rod binding domain-containing protein
MLYVTPPSMERGLAAAAGADNPARRSEALKEFEHVFLKQLLDEMRKTVPKNGLLGDSPSQQYFDEMLDDVYAGQMAESGQFGIARDIAAQWDAASAAVKARVSSNAATMPINIAGVLP